MLINSPKLLFIIFSLCFYISFTLGSWDFLRRGVKKAPKNSISNNLSNLANLHKIKNRNQLNLVKVKSNDSPNLIICKKCNQIAKCGERIISEIVKSGEHGKMEYIHLDCFAQNANEIIKDPAFNSKSFSFLICKMKRKEVLALKIEDWNVERHDEGYIAFINEIISRLLLEFNPKKDEIGFWNNNFMMTFYEKTSNQSKDKKGFFNIPRIYFKKAFALNCCKGWYARRKMANIFRKFTKAILENTIHYLIKIENSILTSEEQVNMIKVLQKIIDKRNISSIAPKICSKVQLDSD